MTVENPPPEVAQRGEQGYVGSTETVTMATINRAADRIPEIIGLLAERGVAPTGAPFLRYRVIDMESQVVVEAGVPVDVSAIGSILDESDLEVGSLPAGRYVTMTHHGRPERLQEANATLIAWAGDHDVRWDVSVADDGQHWACRLETYLTSPIEQPDPDRWMTEIAIKTVE